MIQTLDLQFLGSSHTIASYLIDTSAGPVLVETGPHSTFETMKSELAKHNLQPTDIQHVLLPHIHLDHAGAAWAFAKNGATIYVHPFGQKHLAEPGKLMASAKRIYQDKMDELWGEMHPIPANQLKTVLHGESLIIGDTVFRAWHTPGHAVHHIAWQVGQNVLTGDVAGVKINEGMVVPPCPPPDINVEDWQKSIRLLESLNPEALYLTHFGSVTDVQTHLGQLESELLAWANWIKPYAEEQDVDKETLTRGFQVFVANRLKANGITEKEELERYEKANPSWMSVAGLLRYWRKKWEAEK